MIKGIINTWDRIGIIYYFCIKYSIINVHM